MTWTAVGASIAIAIPLTAAAVNGALHWRRTSPPDAAAGAGGRRGAAAPLSKRAWFDEVGATFLLFFAPLAALLPRRRPRADDADRPPLLVVQGPLSATASWLLLRRLRASGWCIRTYTTTARPFDTDTVDALATSLLAAAAADDGGRPLLVLGIGGAGLLARQLAARAPRIARLVTLATPHRGTLCAIAATSSRPKSRYLEAVARMDPEPRHFDAISIYSDGDAWLEPRDAAYYWGSFNLEVHDLGHFSTLFSRRVFDYVLENLGAELPPETPARLAPDQPT